MQLSPTGSPQPHEIDRVEFPDLAAGQDGATGNAGALDPSEIESLMLNLDASLQVHSRPHFFTWTQGLLQGLLRHEVLICALRDGEPLSLRADSFSMIAPDPAIYTDLFLRDASVARSLIKAWEERHFRPVTFEVGGDCPFARGAFARELERAGAPRLFAHGIHDADGQATSFFIFACVPGAVGPKQAYLLQLAVPFLHSAWVRTQVNGRLKAGNDPKPAGGSNVTLREQEILKWIYLGKSNIEIGTILNISPLTVKNHVQKLLRKLNVLNRTQAIGKALELRILRP